MVLFIIIIIIRDLLSRRERYRWCGAELESIFNENIVKNACEINGLANLGRCISSSGMLTGSYPCIMTTNYSYHVQEHVQSFEDDGQKKLAAIFHSFAIAYSTIVYVGSAPGNGWLSALAMYPNIEKVISIDPRPLDHYSDERVTHYQDVLKDRDHLYELIGSFNNCALIWDVRGDCTDDSSRDSMISSEIHLLNSILNDPRLENQFFALHLKINLRHICLYELPTDGAFYIQPYTLQRDVFEARYVVHLRSGLAVDFFSPTDEIKETIIREMSEVKEKLASDLLCEGHLIANLMCGRLRRVNYIKQQSYNNPTEEICLFTINHNSPSDILHYVTDLKSRQVSYLISFFSGQALGSDPHIFPEGDIVLQGLGTILDSRSFIKAKIEGLYFLISDCMITLMNEETYTSETYKIRRTEYTMANRSRTPAYDNSRNAACSERNLCFPKFPNAFSISQQLVSPSGHALRMAVEYLNGDASIAMMAQKIVNNFRNVKRAYVHPSIGSTLVDPKNSAFRSSLRHDGSGRVSLERSPHSIWHSKLEWIIGIESAIKLKEPKGIYREQLRSVCQFIDKTIICAQPGTEIASFMNRAFGSITPLSQSRGKGVSNHQHNPDRSHIEIAADMLEFLSRRNSPDPVRWLTSGAAARSSAQLWREAITRLKADACARDFLIHTTIVTTLDNRFKEHDQSKLDPLEFVLNVLATAKPEDSKYMHLLHYWGNSHHPEHKIVRRLRPDLRRILTSKNSLTDVLVELQKLQDELTEIMSVSHLDDALIMDEKDVDEFVIDLLARRWQKELRNLRGFSSEELCNVNFKFLSKPTIPMHLVKNKLTEK